MDPSCSVRLTRRPPLSQVTSRPCRSRVLPLALFEGWRNTLTPPDLIDVVPLPGFKMIDELTEQDRRDLQSFVDFASETGVLQGKVDTSKFMVVLDRPKT